jgi:hypothetical protein
MAARLLLDTNLLLLFAVGETDKQYIRKHKRLQSFDEKDYLIVCQLIIASSGLLFCPNIVSETSNLARYAPEPLSSEISLILRTIVSRVDETFITSRIACNHKDYLRLGVTDSVLLTLSESGAFLLTDDLPLYLAAITSGLNAENYNHIRERRSDFLS